MIGHSQTIKPRIEAMKKHNRLFPILVVLGAVTLVACGSKTDVNEKNISAAMTQYFAKKGGLCITTRAWPKRVPESRFKVKNSPLSAENKTLALEAAGLVKSEVVEENNAGEKARLLQFTLTDAAKAFIKERDFVTVSTNGSSVTAKHVDICWGRKAVDKIVKWEGPIKLGDYQEILLTYTYRIENLPDWAKNPAVQTAFPEIRTAIADAAGQELKHGIKLTSLGWEAVGLD